MNNAGIQTSFRNSQVLNILQFGIQEHYFYNFFFQVFQKGGKWSTKAWLDFNLIFMLAGFEAMRFPTSSAALI